MSELKSDNQAIKVDKNNKETEIHKCEESKSELKTARTPQILQAIRGQGDFPGDVRGGEDWSTPTQTKITYSRTGDLTTTSTPCTVSYSPTPTPTLTGWSRCTVTALYDPYPDPIPISCTTTFSPYTERSVTLTATATISVTSALRLGCESAQTKTELTDDVTTPNEELNIGVQRIGAGFPAILDTSSLSCANGFKLTAGGNLGRAVSWVGDINGDGKDDLIIGTDYANAAYVVFGVNGALSTADTYNLNGINGFKLFSSNGNFGNHVAGIGDVNGDGKPDILVGTCCFSNKAYVIFGADTFPSELDASTLNGTNGFILTSSTSTFGDCIAGIGDVNGDGYDDLAVGTFGSSQEAYVIFGTNNVGSSGILDTSSLDGTNGFKLTSSIGSFGTSIAGIGDINGDGKSDFIINGEDKAYVFLGASDVGVSGTLDTFSLEGSNGFTITSASDRQFGRLLTGAGDINGDGCDDLIVGAPDTNKAYIIFGADNFPSTISASNLNGANGFTLNIPLHGYYGFRTPIAKAGDINGDGKSDLVVGIRDSNAAYVIFGASNIGSSGILEPSKLNGTDGFKIVSSSAGFGKAVSRAGDFNGDGMDDLVVGAPDASTVYVIFGQNTTPTLDQVQD